MHGLDCRSLTLCSTSVPQCLRDLCIYNHSFLLIREAKDQVDAKEEEEDSVIPEMKMFLNEGSEAVLLTRGDHGLLVCKFLCLHFHHIKSINLLNTEEEIPVTWKAVI